MRTRTILFLFISVICCACNQIDQKDLSGQWLINKAFFKGAPIKINSKSFRVAFVPVGYEANYNLNFNVKDSTVSFPGILTEDIPCKWVIDDNKLTINFDAATFNNDALFPIDSLKQESLLKHDSVLIKTYAFKRDSILKKKNIDSLLEPIKIYTGTYNIEKIRGGLILTSATTKFELYNLDYITKQQIDGMFKGL